MARQRDADEHDGYIPTEADWCLSLKKNFNIILPQLNSKSYDVAGHSTIIPNEGYGSIPTECELLLLVCSMFPLDFRLPIEDLVLYGMALKLFEDVHTSLQVRCKVYSLIENINRRMPPLHVNKLCLWEDKYGIRFVKIVNDTYDLAKLIALKYQLAVCHKTSKRKWSSINWERYLYGLSVFLRRMNKDHGMLESMKYLCGLSHVQRRMKEDPGSLKSEKFALLQVQHMEDSLPIDFLEGLEELLVLSLDVPSSPQSLNGLSNLRTLRLKIHKLEDLSWIGGLRNLEILLVSSPSFIDIPEEMGQLGNMKLLDLRKTNLAFIAPGVLSRMMKLEELYLPLSFRRWGCRAQEEHEDYDDWGSWEDGVYDDVERKNASVGNINDEERINASISEIVSHSLTALQIIVPNSSGLPKQPSIFKNIQWFKILLPDNLKYKPLSKYYLSNVLHLTGDAFDIKESGICDLMSRTKDLNLTRVKSLKNVMYEMGAGFPQLQKMIVSECDDLEYVIDTTDKQTISQDHSFSKLEVLHLSMLSNLNEIWNGRKTNLVCFENLKQISIRFCHKLKHVFPISIVGGCMLLKRIEILNCAEMEGIFCRDDKDDNPLEHYSVEELDLHSLPKLVGFLVRKVITVDCVHNGADQLTTNEIMSTCVEGSGLNESCSGVEELIHLSPTSTCTRNLRQLVSNKQVSPMENDDRIIHMEKYGTFSSKLAGKLLQNLKRLKIAFCDSVKVVFMFEENHVTSAAFNSLRVLELYGLRNLMHVWFSVPTEIIAFQNLQVLILSECQNLYLFSPRVAKLLVQLEKVCIYRCEKLEAIIVKEDENETENKIVFPQLKILELQHTTNLKTFSSLICPIHLPLLESLKLNQCNNLNSFSLGSLWTPMLKMIQIDGSFYSSLGDLNATMERYMIGNLFAIPSNDAVPNSKICPTSPTAESSNTISVPTSLWSDAASEANEEADPYGQILEGPNYMKEFTLADLKMATNNFSPDNLLWEGGNVEVYKGWLNEKTFAPAKTGIGMPIAVKRFEPRSVQVPWDEQSVLLFLQRQSHPNLVKFLGHYCKDKELHLVYEFMQRGSLDTYLHSRNPGIEPLSWDLRIKVAIGVAQGLTVLHSSEKTNNVIHLDIKPSHILLDSDYNAKISGFGIATRGPTNANSYLKTEVMGTPGYLDPAYAKSGRVSVKSDVYSFGVVLLELMTGLKVVDGNRPEKQINLVKWFRPISSRERELEDIMDSTMKGQYSSKAMLLTANLASKCTKFNPRKRPTMREVLEELQQIDAIK